MRVLVSSLLILMLSSSVLALTSSPPSILIISNAFDRYAAEELAHALRNAGVNARIVGPSELDLQSYGANVIIVLGGPKAYEGVGNISASILGKQYSSYLISVAGSFLGYLADLNDTHWLVLAGHTREETLASVLYFESTYFSDTPLEAYAIGYMRSLGNATFEYKWVGLNMPSPSILTREVFTPIEVNGTTGLSVNISFSSEEQAKKGEWVYHYYWVFSNGTMCQDHYSSPSKVKPECRKHQHPSPREILEGLVGNVRYVWNDSYPKGPVFNGTVSEERIDVPAGTFDCFRCSVDESWVDVWIPRSGPLKGRWVAMISRKLFEGGPSPTLSKALLTKYSQG